MDNAMTEDEQVAAMRSKWVELGADRFVKFDDRMARELLRRCISWHYALKQLMYEKGTGDKPDPKL